MQLNFFHETCGHWKMSCVSLDFGLIWPITAIIHPIIVFELFPLQLKGI
ncbi:hypothetical protein CSC43_2076 [Pseudomonas aeruginosa]|nr:hypothetical protein CSC43_2076 [Pseudomonas aeruginosa]